MARKKHDQLQRLMSRKADRSPVPSEVDDNEGGERSLRRTKAGASGLSQGAAMQFLSSLDSITRTLTAPDVNNYFVFCLKPNDRRIANQFDSKCVRQQVQMLGIAEISQRLRTADFSLFLPFGEFLGLADTDTGVVGSDAEKSQLVLDAKAWPSNEARIGNTGVFLSERCWASIAMSGTQAAHYYGVDDDGVSAPGTPGNNPFSDSKARLFPQPRDTVPATGAYIYGDETKGGAYFGSKEIDAKSDAGASAFHSGDMFRNMETKEELAEKGNKKKLEEIDIVPTSSSRKRWLFLVYLLTWYIPDFSIKWIGRMPRKDVRTAWREKLAINLLIWLSCAFAIFFIVIFPQVICPKQYVFSAAELSAHDGKGNNNAYVSIRGVVLDLGAFIPSHYPYIIPGSALEKYAGIDATGLFPVQVSALCQGKDGRVDPTVQLDYTTTNTSGTRGLTGSLSKWLH
jgi:chitin synthase